MDCEFALRRRPVKGLLPVLPYPGGNRERNLFQGYELGFDFDGDGVTTLGDVAAFERCFTGDGGFIVDPCCRLFDLDDNESIDLADFAALSTLLTGP